MVEIPHKWDLQGDLEGDLELHLLEDPWLDPEIHLLEDPEIQDFPIGGEVLPILPDLEEDWAILKIKLSDCIVVNLGEQAGFNDKFV